MVLNDLGRGLREALYNFSKTPAVDEKALNELLKDVCRSLLEADVNVKLVQNLRANIKNLVNFESLASGVNKQKIIQKAIFDELCRLVDPAPGHEPYQPTKGRPNIVMFVGLQGAGKTTSCTKYGYFYQRKGLKVGLVCADTFRAGAFDQLKQNATKAKLPFYGSYTESDPVQIAKQGVDKFRLEKFDLILIDTSGRHKQESELFVEMQQIAAVAKPDHIVFVMDGSIGQSADAQARAFQEAVDIGAIILTKMDGHARGGGAISGVAATGSPILFIGTGEHVHDLDRFSARPFISKLLGMGDIGGLIDQMKDLNLDESVDMQRRLEQGIFTLRDLYDQFQMIMSLGPIGKVMANLPGFTSDMFKGSEKEISSRFKNHMTIMDSMTVAELDGDAKCFGSQPTRVRRIAKGSGTSEKLVHELLAQYRQFAAIMKKMGGPKGLFKQLGGLAGGPGNGGGGGGRDAGGKMNPQQMAKLNQQMSQMMPPDFLNQMGGIGGLSSMMKQFQDSFGGAASPSGGTAESNQNRKS